MPEQNTPQPETIHEHLNHITRRWSELGKDCLLEIVHLTADDRASVKDVSHFRADQIEDAAAHVAAMNKYRLNSYATVNPIDADNRPKAGKRANSEHVIASFFHWADADDQQAAENIKNFVGPKWTFHVLTGTQPTRRPHVYWELAEATTDLAGWERIQRAIAAKLKTDPAVVDPPRIMRIAGTVNWPKPQKREKGYQAELTVLTIFPATDRPPVTSEQMARAFNSPATSDAVHIDTGTHDGRGVSEYADMLRRAHTDGEKHTGVRDLAASLAGQGVNKAMAEAIIRQSCPVWDDNTQDLLDSAYEKFSQPAPIEATPQTISDFRIDNSSAFLADLQPLEYLIEGILPVGVAYSLTGHAGHGKTTLALQFALSVARGEMFAGRETSKGRVLILAGENPYNVKWQYAAALAARGIKADEVNIDFIQGRFSIETWSQVLQAKMQAMPDLKLIIIDSLQAFFEGDNDNDNAQMVEMAQRLRDMADVPQRPALLIIAHPAGKTASKDNLVPRGGGAFLNEIDGNLTVWSQDATQQTLHHSQKFRGASFDPVEWVMQIHEFPHLTDIKGTPLKLPVSRPETVSEQSSREDQADAHLRRFLETVEAENPLSIREMSSQFRISRWRAEQVRNTAKAENLIKRYAKTWVITDGGRDFING